MNSKTAELNALKNSLEEFVATAERFPNELRQQKPTETAFSATEIVYHMCDVEALWQSRLQKLFSGETREFIAMNPDQVALDNQYNGQDYLQGIARLRDARRQSLDLFSSLTDEQFELSGNHTRYGEMSISRIVETMTNHDLQHAKQLERTLSELKATQPA